MGPKSSRVLFASVILLTALAAPGGAETVAEMIERLDREVASLRSQLASVSLSLPLDETTSTIKPALSVRNTGTGGGIVAQSNNGIAVWGKGSDRSVIGTQGETSCAGRPDVGRKYAVGGCGTTGDGVVGRSRDGYAGYFAGDVLIEGRLIKRTGSFQIDHPLDPENKFLAHSFVESPEMLNVYSGVAKLDEKGTAVVELPDWFEALNEQYRYQLTAIGAPSPNLYVSGKISENRFEIGGGASGLEVSWQVVGVRRDSFAQEHPIPVEEWKPGQGSD